MGRVIYLTGAPASGKTTLSERIADRLPGIQLFKFGRELADYLSKREAVSPDALRSGTDSIVTPQDVIEINRLAADFAAQHRNAHHVIIDTHALTREAFGFRMTPIGADLVRELNPDVLVTLVCPPGVLAERVKKDAKGRPPLSDWQLSLQTELQNVIPTTYAILCDRPAYFFENVREEDLGSITDRVVQLLEN